MLVGEEGDEGAAPRSSGWIGAVAARKRAAAFGERRSVRTLLPVVAAPRGLIEFAGSIVKAGSRAGSDSPCREGSSGYGG